MTVSPWHRADTTVEYRQQISLQRKSPSALNVCSLNVCFPQFLLLTNFFPHFSSELNNEELKVIEELPTQLHSPVHVCNTFLTNYIHQGATNTYRGTTSPCNEPLQRALAKEEGLGPWETSPCGLSACGRWPVGRNHAAGRSSFLKASKKKNKNRKIFQILYFPIFHIFL